MQRMLIPAVHGLRESMRQEAEDAAHEAEWVLGRVDQVRLLLLVHVLGVAVLVSMLRAGGRGGFAVVNHVRVLPALPVIELG